MFVLSLLKKTAQPTEYYFDNLDKAKKVLKSLDSRPWQYFEDDYGNIAFIIFNELVEATIIDAEKRKLAMHECKMIDDYTKLKINKLTLSDSRTAEILQAQQPISQDNKPN